MPCVRRTATLPLAFVVCVLVVPGVAATLGGAVGESLAAATPQDSSAVEASLALDRSTRLLIQQGLRNEGFDPGIPDGLFGPRTRAAIRDWQQSRGASPTGYLNGVEAELRRTAAAPPPAVPEAPPPPQAVPAVHPSAGSVEPARRNPENPPHRSNAEGGLLRLAERKPHTWSCSSTAYANWRRQSRELSWDLPLRSQGPDVFPQPPQLLAFLGCQARAALVTVRPPRARPSRRARLARGDFEGSVGEHGLLVPRCYEREQSLKDGIAWFARNPVAANLMMVFIIMSGAIATQAVREEVFPELELNRVRINVPYLGAAPEEVESGVILRIEEAIQGIDGIKEIQSTASEGSASVMVELELGADARRVVDEVKNQVDAITTFPLETEEPIIRELTARNQVSDIAISGDTDVFALKALAERCATSCRRCRRSPRSTSSAHPPYEISIEVSETGAAAARDDVRPGGRRGAPVVARPARRLGPHRRRRDPAAHHRSSLPRRRVRGPRAVDPVRRHPPATRRRGDRRRRLRRDRPVRALRPSTRR